MYAKLSDGGFQDSKAAQCVFSDSLYQTPVDERTEHFQFCLV